MRRTILCSLALFLVWSSFAHAAVTVRMPELSARPEGSILVPIAVDGAAGVAGGSITLTFGGDVVSAKEVQQTPLIANFHFVSNIVGNEVRFAFANATGLTSSNGTIANVSLTVNAQAKDKSVSPLTLSKAVLYNENAQSIATTVSNGKLTVDTTPPSIEISPSLSVVKNGQSFTLTVLTESGSTVTADVSQIDSTQTQPVPLPETKTAGTYTAEIAISAANTSTNGIKTITVNATAVGNIVATKTATIELRNFNEFVLPIPQGMSLIHLPLVVKSVNDKSMEIRTTGDLYDALGSSNVNFIITFQPGQGTARGVWSSFLGQSSRGTSADRKITDDLRIITVMKSPVTLNLKGDALGKDGVSQMNITPGTNLIGVPLKSEKVKRVSDLLTLEGLAGKVTSIIVSDKGVFKVVARPDDDGDIPITGGQSFIIIARAAGVAEITGVAWDNVSGDLSAAPPLVVIGHQVNESTPVLALYGAVVDEVTGTRRNLAQDGFRVTVKNLSTGAFVSALSGGDTPDGYSLTVVDALSNRAARAGDVLEITAESPSPLIGVQPLRHIVSIDEVKESQILLPDLIVYQIPKETKLLPNYPNPFNPETWVPFRLAKDSFVTLSIYDVTGAVVRAISVGHKPAAVYESKDKAIYWDGRNDFGERVASGVYFYTLTANDFTATRKMLILK